MQKQQKKHGLSFPPRVWR